MKKFFVAVIMMLSMILNFLVVGCADDSTKESNKNGNEIVAASSVKIVKSHLDPIVLNAVEAEGEKSSVVLTATVIPKNATDTEVSWSVSLGADFVELSATTGSSVTVSAKARGTAKIKAAAGEKFTETNIIVREHGVSDEIVIDGETDDWPAFENLSADSQSTVPERYNFQSKSVDGGLYVLAIQNVDVLVEGQEDPAQNTHFVLNEWDAILSGWTPYGLHINFFKDELDFFCFNDDATGERTDADGNIIDYTCEYEYERKVIDNGEDAEYRYTIIYEAYIGFDNISGNIMYIQYYFRSFGDPIDIPAGTDAQLFPAKEGVTEWSDSCKSYAVGPNGITQRMYT